MWRREWAWRPEWGGGGNGEEAEVGWKWVELIKGKDTEASGTVGVWESESQGHLLWSSVLTGSTTREEPREAELARTMLPVCGPAVPSVFPPLENGV